jgi:hypothetical protein
VQRGSNGKPITIPFGQITAPRGTPGAILVAKSIHQPHYGRDAGRWYRALFPPDAERGTLPYLRIGDKAMSIPATPFASTRLENHGGDRSPVELSASGLRFSLRELHVWLHAPTSMAPSARCPIRHWTEIIGFRRRSSGRAKVLAELGVNPLVISASARGPWRECLGRLIIIAGHADFVHRC